MPIRNGHELQGCLARPPIVVFQPSSCSRHLHLLPGSTPFSHLLRLVLRLWVLGYALGGQIEPTKQKQGDPPARNFLQYFE